MKNEITYNDFIAAFKNVLKAHCFVKKVIKDKILGVNSLKTIITEANKSEKKKGKIHGMGSSNWVDKIQKYEKTDLIKIYNTYIGVRIEASDEKIPIDSGMDSENILVKLLKENTSIFSDVKQVKEEGDKSERILKIFQVKINSTIKFVPSEINPEELKDCEIVINNAHNTESEHNTQQLEVNDKKLQEKIEQYFVHYIGVDEKPVFATVEMKIINDITGEKLINLENVRMTQYISPFNEVDKRFFSSTSIDKFVPEKKSQESLFFFIKFESDKSSRRKQSKIILQATIEMAIQGPREICTGFFNSIEKHQHAADKPNYISPVGGSVVLELVKEEYENKLYNTIKILKDIHNNPFEFNEKLEESQNFWLIRHSIQRKRVSNHKEYVKTYSDLPMRKSWDEVYNKYNGLYKVYFLRTSDEPTYETGIVKIFLDGRSVLRLKNDNQNRDIPGYVIADDRNLWAFFGYKKHNGLYRVRIILTTAGYPNLFGTYSSEASNDVKHPAGGRIVFSKLLHLDSEKAYKQLNTEPLFESQIENSLKDFFIGKKYPFYSDGPTWAKYQQNYLEGPIKDILELIGDKNYYYYTFKQEEDDNPEQGAYIERNLVRFKVDGSVEIVANNTTYEGRASFSNKTLKLTLFHSATGYLEVFLECDSDIRDAKIFYGISLWHSAHRIQGKAVVLYQIEIKDKKTTGFETFTLPNLQDNLQAAEKKVKKIEDEDLITAGILSYLRGIRNRYIYTTHKPSSKLRPRKRQNREVHFLAACYLGSELQTKKFDQNYKECCYHLQEAMVHGYASFKYAGIEIDEEKIINLEKNKSRKKENELKKILESFPIDEKYQNRIIEIAKEKEALKNAIRSKGPLSHYKIIQEIKKLWPWINDLPEFSIEKH